MTDERIGRRLWDAVDALPDGAGIVFRHYSLADDARLQLGAKLAEVARRRGLTFAVAGNGGLAKKLGADFVHKPGAPVSMPWSTAVHDEAQALAAQSAGAVLAFVGPVYPTRSHPGAASLGAERAASLARAYGGPAIALGGMDIERFTRLQAAHPGAFHGFAGIDCWLRD